MPWIAVAALAAVVWVVTVMLARDMGNGPRTMGLALLPFLGLWVVMMLPLRAALRVIDAEVTRRTAAARLLPAS